MSYFFDVSEQGHTYRVGIHGGPGLNTLTNAYLEKYGLPVSRRADYMDSLERLRDQRVDIFIGCHPGQNDTLAKRAAMTEKRNPFIDPEAWPRFLAELERNARELFGPGAT